MQNGLLKIKKKSQYMTKEEILRDFMEVESIGFGIIE